MDCSSIARDICYSDDGTTFCKHTVTSTCICSKCDCNSSSDDSWMPQCDHVQSFHFVLGYLLLLGYDVTGASYIKRVEGLAVGMILCMIIFYKNQKNRPYRRTFLDLFREFDLHSARGRWYLKLTFIVSSAMLFMNLLGLPRAMWAGIACMSVCLPFTKDCVARSGSRWQFNIVGCAIFIVLYLVLPESMYPYIGMIGGIGVGYSAGYAWQTVFNTFGALSIAAGLFGMPAAVALRVGANIFGAAYTVICNKVIDKLADRIYGQTKCRSINITCEQ